MNRRRKQTHTQRGRERESKQKREFIQQCWNEGRSKENLNIFLR